MRDWRAWFGLAWRDDKRAVVLNDYASMAQAHPLFLADLALRGNVYDDSNPPTGNDIDVGIYLGRRQLALETIKLCGKTPQQLQAYMTPPTQPETRR
jgi:hypothetical protein